MYSKTVLCLSEKEDDVLIKEIGNAEGSGNE